MKPRFSVPAMMRPNPETKVTALVIATALSGSETEVRDHHRQDDWRQQ
jgi:hypothetical protein